MLLLCDDNVLISELCLCRSGAWWQVQDALRLSSDLHAQANMQHIAFAEYVHTMTHTSVWRHGLDNRVCFAGAVAIFLPLFEAREIVEAVFGFGQLADARKRRAAAQNLNFPSKPSPNSSLGPDDVELGKHKLADSPMATPKLKASEP